MRPRSSLPGCIPTMKTPQSWPPWMPACIRRRCSTYPPAGWVEDSQTNNTNVLVPKVGLRWQPFDEQLTLRATWGEGFREPSLEELFGSPVSTLEVTHDPLKGGLLESETNVLISSNPN